MLSLSKNPPRTRLSVHIITISVWNNDDDDDDDDDCDDDELLIDEKDGDDDDDDDDAVGDKEDVDLKSDELLVDEKVMDLPDVDAQLHLDSHSSFTMILTIDMLAMLMIMICNYHD